MSSALATLFLMVGLPGSGKTTLAKEIEREQRALRLSPDEWILALSLDPYSPVVRGEVESLQWGVAARALELGCSVILDFGFWSRRERDDYRARAHRLGVSVAIRFLDVPPDTLRARLTARRVDAPAGGLPVSHAELERYRAAFEAPSQDELEPLAVL